MFSATLKPMYTWLSDYAAKLLASGLIKREKLMSGFTSLLIVSSSAIVLTMQRWDIMTGLKERKKSPAFMYPLNGMKQD